MARRGMSLAATGGMQGPSSVSPRSGTTRDGNTGSASRPTVRRSWGLNSSRSLRSSPTATVTNLSWRPRGTATPWSARCRWCAITGQLTEVFEYDRWTPTRAPIYILAGLYGTGDVLGERGPCDRACALLWHADWLYVEPELTPAGPGRSRHDEM